MQGFDYLVEWHYNDKLKKSPKPSLVKGKHLIVEAPFLYRDFIETKYCDLKIKKLK